VRRLPSVRFTHVPRERNKHADRLANEAMDAAARGLEWQARTEVPEPEPEPTKAPRTGWGVPSGPATTMLLLRHGQTPLSVERRFSGAGDPELTALGHAQAAGAATRITEWDVAAVVSSPRQRARQTANAVAEVLGLDVTVEDGLAETDFGEWEGFTFAEIRERWPKEMAAWLADPDVAPPGGESFTATFARVRTSRERLVATHPGETIVVVSHVTPIKALVREALDAPPHVLYRIHLDPASLSTIDWYADGAGVVRLVNDTGHLRSVGGS